MRPLAPLLLFLWLVLPALAEHVSPLASPPDWHQLDAFQETISQAEFERLLNEVYAPGGAAREVIQIAPEAATISTGGAQPYVLRFTPVGQEKAAPRTWKRAAEMPAPPPEKPLDGLRIAIDPGHLGGEWARMEERFFQIGESKPVIEGDLTLRVAQMLVPRLENLGAKVMLVRANNTPVTQKRPLDLREIARGTMPPGSNPPETYRDMNDPSRGSSVQFHSEMLFYRMSEIRARAAVVNEQLKPDLTLCLHFNGEAWGDPLHPQFVNRNHVHVLVNGCYLASELKLDDVRFEMLHKLLSRAFDEESPAAGVMADSLARATSLPPYTYMTKNAVAVGTSGYVWARNLLADRLYQTPVLFLEPYVMNSEIVWERVQAGDYDGEITLGGAPRKSIFREYADAVADGLATYYRTARANLGKSETPQPGH